MQNITMDYLDKTRKLFDPFDIDFPFVQASSGDLLFKEASVLIEKAENIRLTLASALKSIFSISEAKNLINATASWIYSISASFQGRIIDSGLKFEYQYPFVKLNADIGGEITEHFKTLVRFPNDGKASLNEIAEQLNLVGKKVDANFNQIKIELEKLELTPMINSVSRRNITSNLQKISASVSKIRELEKFFKYLEHEKKNFINLCNNILVKADEFGLRGCFEKRFTPAKYQEILDKDIFLNIKQGNEEKEKEFSVSPTSKANITSQIDFDTMIQMELVNSEKNIKQMSEEKIPIKSKENEDLENKLGCFPMMIPFNQLTIGSIVGSSPKGVINEARLFGKKVTLKRIILEESDLLILLSELMNFHHFINQNMVRLYGISLIRDPLSVYLINEYYPYSLQSIVFGQSKITLSLLEKIEISIELAHIIDYLCKMELVHGNISMKNILVNNDKKAFLADYGISKIIKKSLRKQFTCKFDSPEFLSNNKWDTSQDIYSFGIVLFELFNEKEAWEGMKEEEILTEKIKKKNFYSKNNFNIKEVDDIIEGCISVSDRKKADEILSQLMKLKGRLIDK